MLRKLIAFSYLLALPALALDALPWLSVMEVEAGGDWTPAELSGLEIWLDATDGATMWEDISATVQTTNGGKIAQWDDKSGNARHAKRATEAHRPVLTDDRVVFDGSDDYMDSTSATIAQPYELWAACNFPTDPAVGLDIMGSLSPLVLVRPQQDAAHMLAYAGAVGLQPSRLFAGNHIIGAYFNGSASLVRTNGVASTTGNAGTASLGTPVRYSRQINVPGYLASSCIGFVVVSGTLSDADRQKLEGYFAHQGGITDILPSDHPYKSTPP